MDALLQTNLFRIEDGSRTPSLASAPHLDNRAQGTAKPRDHVGVKCPSHPTEPLVGVPDIGDAMGALPASQESPGATSAMRRDHFRDMELPG